MSDKSGDFLAGFVLGGLVGAAVALLLAPQSGEETRAVLRERGIELKEQADELSADAKKTAVEWQEKGKAAAEKAKDDLLRKVQEGEAGPEAEAGPEVEAGLEAEA